MVDATAILYSHNHDSNMDVDAAGHADAHSPLQRSEHSKVVQLSGPIRIILSDNEWKDDKHDDAGKYALASWAPPDANHDSAADRMDLSDIDARDHGKSDNGDCEVAASNIDATKPTTSTIEQGVKAKEFDCNNPDDTLSPL